MSKVGLGLMAYDGFETLFSNDALRLEPIPLFWGLRTPLSLNTKSVEGILALFEVSKRRRAIKAINSVFEHFTHDNRFHRSEGIMLLQRRSMGFLIECAIDDCELSILNIVDTNIESDEYGIVSSIVIRDGIERAFNFPTNLNSFLTQSSVRSFDLGLSFWFKWGWKVKFECFFKTYYDRIASEHDTCGETIYGAEYIPTSLLRGRILKFLIQKEIRKIFMHSLVSIDTNSSFFDEWAWYHSFADWAAFDRKAEASQAVWAFDTYIVRNALQDYASALHPNFGFKVHANGWINEANYEGVTSMLIPSKYQPHYMVDTNSCNVGSEISGRAKSFDRVSDDTGKKVWIDVLKFVSNKGEQFDISEHQCAAGRTSPKVDGACDIVFTKTSLRIENGDLQFGYYWTPKFDKFEKVGQFTQTIGISN